MKINAPRWAIPWNHVRLYLWAGWDAYKGVALKLISKLIVKKIVVNYCSINHILPFLLQLFCCFLIYYQILTDMSNFDFCFVLLI